MTSREILRGQFAAALGQLAGTAEDTVAGISGCSGSNGAESPPQRPQQQQRGEVWRQGEEWGEEADQERPGAPVQQHSPPGHQVQHRGRQLAPVRAAAQPAHSRSSSAFAAEVKRAAPGGQQLVSSSQSSAMQHRANGQAGGGLQQEERQQDQHNPQSTFDQVAAPPSSPVLAQQGRDQSSLQQQKAEDLQPQTSKDTQPTPQQRQQQRQQQPEEQQQGAARWDSWPQDREQPQGSADREAESLEAPAPAGPQTNGLAAQQTGTPRAPRLGPVRAHTLPGEQNLLPLWMPARQPAAGDGASSGASQNSSPPSSRPRLTQRSSLIVEQPDPAALRGGTRRTLLRALRQLRKPARPELLAGCEHLLGPVYSRFFIRSMQASRACKPPQSLFALSRCLQHLCCMQLCWCFVLASCPRPARAFEEQRGQGNRHFICMGATLQFSCQLAYPAGHACVQANALVSGMAPLIPTLRFEWHPLEHPHRLPEEAAFRAQRLCRRARLPSRMAPQPARVPACSRLAA